MKVVVRLEVGDWERYVIARHFGAASDVPRDQRRPRATRKQVRRFAQAAVRSLARQLEQEFRGRRRAAAARLRDGAADAAAEVLPEPREKQLTLI